MFRPKIVQISEGGQGVLPRSSIPAVPQRAGCECALGCAETGTARLSSLPNAPLVLLYLRMDFFSYDVASQSWQKSIVPVETQHSSPHLNESAQQAQSWGAHFFRRFPFGLY